MDYCEKLIGFYYATDTDIHHQDTLAAFPSWIDAKGVSIFPLDWSDAAAALRLAAAIGQWRRLDGPEIVGQTDVRNVSLLTTREEVIAWISQTIGADRETYLADPQTHFTTADPRSLKLFSRLAERIKTDVAAIGAAPVMPDKKSVPVVDRLLRKLAGYMTAHQIEFPIPPANSQN